MAAWSPWDIGACPMCIALSLGSFVPLLKAFIVIQLTRFMTPEMAELMSEADDPIAYLKFKAGDIIIRKFLGDTMADIWGVVSNFLSQEAEPGLEQYQVELSEMTAQESWGFFRKIGNAFKSVGKAVVSGVKAAGRFVVKAGKFVFNGVKNAAHFVAKHTTKFVQSVKKHASKFTASIGRFSAKVWKGVRNAATILAKGAKALGKIIAVIAGKLAASCGVCARIGTNAVYAIIRHVVPNNLKGKFKHIK